MDIEIFTLCDFSSDYSGKLVIVGTFDVIRASNLPVTIPHCSMALRVRFRAGETGKHSLTVQILDPDSKTVVPPLGGELQPQIPLGNDTATINFSLQLDRVTFKTYGRHSIILTIDGQELRSLPLVVVRTKEA